MKGGHIFTLNNSEKSKNTENTENLLRILSDEFDVYIRILTLHDITKLKGSIDGKRLLFFLKNEEIKDKILHFITTIDYSKELFQKLIHDIHKIISSTLIIDNTNLYKHQIVIINNEKEKEKEKEEFNSNIFNKATLENLINLLLENEEDYLLQHINGYKILQDAIRTCIGEKGDINLRDFFATIDNTNKYNTSMNYDYWNVEYLENHNISNLLNNHIEQLIIFLNSIDEAKNIEACCNTFDNNIKKLLNTEGKNKYTNILERTIKSPCDSLNQNTVRLILAKLKYTEKFIYIKCQLIRDFIDYWCGCNELYTGNGTTLIKNGKHGFIKGIDEYFYKIPSNDTENYFNGNDSMHIINFDEQSLGTGGKKKRHKKSKKKTHKKQKKDTRKNKKSKKKTKTKKIVKSRKIK